MNKTKLTKAQPDEDLEFKSIKKPTSVESCVAST